MDLITLSVDNLARHCADETEKFSHHQLSDARYCFELLRRALAEGASEAFTWVYRIYEKQVYKWVRQHYSFEQTGESADYFVNLALSRFYFALRGQKFERFPNLVKVLAYLKVCVHTAIVQYLRDQHPSAEVSFEDLTHLPGSQTPETHWQASELWAHICRCLPNESDQQLARYAFIHGLKPRQIVEYDSAHWSEERQVSLALYRIRQVLRRDEQLRQWLGNPDPFEPETSQ